MNLHNLSDEELLDSVCIADSRSAYEKIYVKFYPDMLRYAHSKLASLEEAEDIVQDILLQIWNRRKQIVLQEKLNNYLIKAVKYKILDHISKSKRHKVYLQSIDQFMHQVIANTDFTARESLFKNYIESEIEKLPPRMRQAFLLSRNENLSHEEIAAQLGLSVHTVSTHIKSAIKILKKKLLIYSFFMIFY